MTNFNDFLRGYGYEPKVEIAPNRFIRFGKNQSVSAKLFPDEKAGFIHDWRTGEKHYWFSDESKTQSPKERLERQQKIEMLKKVEDAKKNKTYKEAAIKAEILFKGSSVALESHPYLVRKKVKPYGINQKDENLLIPIYSVQGDFQSLQYINCNGDKWFMTGGMTRGGCHFIGELKMNEPIYLAEGYATAVSIYEDTKSLTIASFSAMNLLSVAVDVRKSLPDIEIVITGDSDQTGRHYAELASKAVNGKSLIPEFAPNQQGTDWNDYFNMELTL